MWTWGIGWTFIRALKVWKIFHWCVTTPKGDAKCEEKLYCGLKSGISNLVNFHASSRKSVNLLFDWILLSKAYKELDEKVQKGYVSYHWRVCKVWRKTDSWFQKWHEVNFDVRSGKSESLHFDMLLFSIAYKFSARK